MAEARRPLLHGRISRIDTYQPLQRGGSSSQLPARDPVQHQGRLLSQLAAIALQVNARSADARDEIANREIIAVHPALNAELFPDQLSGVRADVRLVGCDPVTGVVLLDAPSVRLEYLRAKIEAFADDSRAETKTAKDGSILVARASERAIAPIELIALATAEDRCSRDLGAASNAGRSRWFEVACRGGYRMPPAETQASRTQIERQLPRIGAPQKLDEFIGPEQVYFFLRLTPAQLTALSEATDCIYEVDLASPALRDLHLLEETTSSDLRAYDLLPPPGDAPAVVILDTGIATNHPLLRPAILSATVAGPEIPSPEDTYGHGTKMAGLCLYRDVGAAVKAGKSQATHWLQSARLLVAPGEGTGTDENHELWPVLTLGAVRSAENAEPRSRNRIFTLAVTRSMQDPPLDVLGPTLWSHAVDQIAYDEGRGRLILVSAGNARPRELLKLAREYPDLHLSEKIHQPAQASNALTVGAYTTRTDIPRTQEYEETHPVARRAGGISPYTSTGVLGSGWPLKPEIVMEGGNLAIQAGTLPTVDVPHLSALTTSHRHTWGRPLTLTSMTSEATARAAHLAASVWSDNPLLRPETVRGLIVHSASWTSEMRAQFQGNNDRAIACGYGVPDEDMACRCTQDRATIIVEDEMPNAVIERQLKKKPPKRPNTSPTEPHVERKVKLFRLPMPNELLSDDDPDVDLRVTLSYFAEPNKYRRQVFHGLNLRWDMQGPQETEPEFMERINAFYRSKNAEGERKRVSKTKPFDWELGPQLRGRGTVQSDRFRGKMSSLAGDKLIAVIPRLGWWDQRRELKHTAMRFSLLVTVRGPDVYDAIAPRLLLPLTSTIET
jgi:hypothetical protein